MAMDGGHGALTPHETARAWRALAKVRPDRSAHRRLTYLQMVVAAAGLGCFGWALFSQPDSVWRVAHIVMFVLFAPAIAFRFLAAAVATEARDPITVSNRDLPLYTILCPLRGEASIVADLISALDRIDYPRERLQIILALEEDDDATRSAVDALRLPAHYEVVLACIDGPRTKPKALNIALRYARGEFCAIYDAEDRPHPQQLRAACAAFAARGRRIACVQAPLLADNAQASWISSQFAAEYAVQFLITLPLLARLGLPLPLGGTSNHFRTVALRAARGWDAYNVTEDADLGYRLTRHGWRVGMIAPPTYEEAPVTLGAWHKQRTRWIKGHMQTWLVLMRNPFRTAAEMGVGSFLAMQLVLGGGVLAALSHLPLAVLMATAPLTFVHVGPQDLALAIAGYGAAIYSGWIGARLARSPTLAFASLTMPLYWMLTFFPAIGALWGLALRPFYWAKTAHGVSARPEPERRRALRSGAPRQVRSPRASPAHSARGAPARGAGSAP